MTCSDFEDRLAAYDSLDLTERAPLDAQCCDARDVWLSARRWTKWTRLLLPRFPRSRWPSHASPVFPSGHR